MSWKFLFHAMQKMRFSERYVRWVKLIFENDSGTVNLNGSLGNKFNIERGVRQGCHLARYIFLIIGEVLTHNIQQTVDEGRLKGIVFPGGKKQQCIAQYANDFSLMIRGGNAMLTN